MVLFNVPELPVRLKVTKSRPWFCVRPSIRYGSFSIHTTCVFAVILEEPPNLVAFYFNLWPLNISLDLDLPVHYLHVFKCNGSRQVVYIVTILSDKFAFVEKRLHDNNGEAAYRSIFFFLRFRAT